MPSNVLRQRASPLDAARRVADGTRRRPAGGPRLAELVIGDQRVRIELADTLTADRLWHALPLFSAAETWGDCIHFEVPIESGRDRTARLNAQPRDILFWSEDDRVVVPWGPTPISRPSEVRLMRPCNLWARALDDPSVFDTITPGEKVSLLRVEGKAT